MSKTQASLKVTQKKLPQSQLGLDIEIPGERSQRAYEAVIKKLMKTAQIPGFRRGKIPRQVIMQRFGAGYLKAATLEDLVQNSINEAIKQEELKVIGNLDLQSSFEDLVEQFNPGEALTFSASGDIPPQITLKTYSGFNLEVEQSVYDESRIETTLNEQQSSHATLVPVDDRAAQEGDMVMVDFVSTFLDDPDDADESGSEMTDFQVELSESRFLPGFVQGVIGMEIDEEKTFDVDFPDDYFEQTLSGRTANFKVTLKDIKAKELPELTDDFAQEISEFKTLQDLKDFLEAQYQKEAEAETEGRLKLALLDALVQEFEGELPKTLIDQEVNVLLNETAARLKSQGVDINQLFTKESIPGFQERFRPDAESQVKRTLALAEVAKAENLEVTSEALEEKFVETLKQVDESQIDRDRLKTILEEELLEEVVVAWLKENSTIKYVDPKDAEDASTPVEEAKPAAKEKFEKKNAANKSTQETETPSDEPVDAPQANAKKIKV